MALAQQPPSLLYIDKPSGITSFDVIRCLRRIFKVQTGQVPKLGHAGTLDPLATGLLIIGVGLGTKQLRPWLGQSKEYDVEILLGLRTDTGDITGELVERQAVNDMAQDQLAGAVAALVGELDLPVPRYSAVKVGGRPLYKAARSGRPIETPRRIMQVLAARLTGWSHTEAGVILKLTLTVASGVYVRSVAEYLGEKLGTVATVKTLRRTRIGELGVEQAMTLESLETNI